MSELPDGWVKLPLGEVNEFASSTVNPATRSDDLLELYSVPSFPTGKPERLHGREIGSTKQTVAPNDVLISKINPRINRVWTVAPKASEDQIASSEWIGFRSSGVQPAFANYYFRSPEFRDLLCSEVAGVGGSLTRAQPKRVATYPIKIAPIAEQIRIADLLDTLLARINACNDRLNGIPGILKRFRQAVLGAAISGSLTEDWRGSDNASWRIVVLSNVAYDFTYGSAAKSVKSGLIPVLRMGNIQGGRLNWTDLVYTSDPSEIVKYRLKKGDVLFNRTNSPELVGKTAVFQGEQEAIFAGYLIRVRCTPDLLPEYLNYCLGSKAGRDYCWSVKSDGVSQSNINAKKLAAFPLSLPALDEQQEIVRRVEALFAQIDRIEACYTAMSAYAQRLAPQALAKAFRGELVEQDPSDEPASSLLARLTSQQKTLSAAQKTRKPHKPRAPRASKEGAKMTKSRQDDDVKDKPYLAGHLRRLAVPTTAEALFKEAELPVADFYKQLTWEVAQGYVSDNRTVLEPSHAAG